MAAVQVGSFVIATIVNAASQKVTSLEKPKLLEGERLCWKGECSLGRGRALRLAF